MGNIAPRVGIEPTPLALLASVPKLLDMVTVSTPTGPYLKGQGYSNNAQRLAKKQHYLIYVTGLTRPGFKPGLQNGSQMLNSFGDPVWSGRQLHQLCTSFV